MTLLMFAINYTLDVLAEGGKRSFKLLTLQLGCLLD